MTHSLKHSQEVTSREGKAVTGTPSDIVGGLDKLLIWLPSSFLLFCSSCRAVAKKHYPSAFSEILLTALELNCLERWQMHKINSRWPKLNRLSGIFFPPQAFPNFFHFSPDEIVKLKLLPALYLLGGP